MSVFWERGQKGLLVDDAGDFIVNEEGKFIAVKNRGTRVIQADSRYRVYMYQRIKSNEWSTTAIEITDYVTVKGISEVSQRVETGDFDIGVFSYDDLQIKFINHKGYFSDEKGTQSLFAWSRDRTRIRVDFTDSNGDVTAEFNGFIQEDHTKENDDGLEVIASVLSRDSIFRKVFIRGGIIPSGATVKEALEITLNRPEITSVLTYSAANMNPPLDVVIEDATEYDNQSAAFVLDSLMRVCGGILIVDNNANIIVRGRGDNANTPHAFYGAGHLGGLANILAIGGIRNGQNRAFNKFVIDETVSFSEYNINKFGLREKTISTDGTITTVSVKQTICDYYLAQFAVPRRECEIVVRTEDAKSVELLDLVTIDYPSVVVPEYGKPKREGYLVDDDGNLIVNEGGDYILAETSARGGRLPFYDHALYGKDLYPVELPSSIINSNIAWKVIEKKQDVSKLETTLKLRESGNNYGEEIV